MSILGKMSEISLEEFKNSPGVKYSNALFRNGLFQRRIEPTGTFTVKIQDVKNGAQLGLTKDCELGFTPSLPKIPIQALYNIIFFFRDVYEKFKSEVYVQIFWNKVKKDYFLYVPKQTISGAQVNFENNAEMFNNTDYVIACEIHSHNVMGK